MPHRIIVLGPVRTGTSLTAEIVRRWGAFAGRQDDIWKDPRGYGYMEYGPLIDLNEALLDHNDRLPPRDQVLAERARDPKFQDWALRLVRTMDEQAAEEGAPAWIWKDPQLPHTLPFWVNFWGDVIYVATVRHPAETILSGAQMEGWDADGQNEPPFAAGLAYWQYCMLNVLTYTQSSPRKIFVAYDQLLNNSGYECARLCRFLDECAERSPDDFPRRLEAMQAHIDRGQHHYRYGKSLAEMPRATREQRALYNFLRVKTLYPDEPYQPDDFAPYPGWREFLECMDMLVSMSKAQAA